MSDADAENQVTAAELHRLCEELEKVDKQIKIKALHALNERRDQSCAILGMLAQHERRTLKELHAEFDLPTDERSCA